MQALPKLRTRDADTTSYVADYLTRSVRRASGLILVGKPEIGTCLRWGMHQKRTARKSRSGELCFTVFTKLYRFWCAHPLPNTTARYRDQALGRRAFSG